METHIQASDLEPLIRALAGDKAETLLGIVANGTYPMVVELMFEFIEPLCADGGLKPDPVRGVVSIEEDDLIMLVELVVENFYEELGLPEHSGDFPQEECQDLIEYIQYTLACLLETLRLPLAWDELTERERGPVESMIAQLVLKAHGAWKVFPSGLLPAPGRPVEFSFKFVLLWCRAEGHAPDWFVDHFCEVVDDEEEDDGEGDEAGADAGAEAEEPAIAASEDKPS